MGGRMKQLNYPISMLSIVYKSVERTGNDHDLTIPVGVVNFLIL